MSVNFKTRKILCFPNATNQPKSKLATCAVGDFLVNQEVKIQKENSENMT